MPSIRLEELPVIMKSDTANAGGAGWNGMKVGQLQDSKWNRYYGGFDRFTR